MKKFVTAFLAVTSLCFGADDSMELLISQEEIAAKVKEAAVQINHDYADKNLTVLMVMKGAICVTSDLIRAIDLPFKLEYLKASSYGYNGMSNGELTIAGLENLEIEGRDILLVDDIFETGNTILGVMDKLAEKKPASIKTLMLLVKDVPRKTDYRPDYVLFDIQDRFVIGYGLDYKELYRGLPGIYAFINDKAPF